MPVAPPPAPRPERGTDDLVHDAADFARADDRQLAEGIVGVRAAVLAARSLSFGVGVPDSAPFVRRASARGIPLVRRSSGGTGLLHEPGDIVWTVVLPRDHRVLAPGFTRAYPRLGEGVVAGLRAVGVESAWVPAPGLVEQYCTLSSLGSVLSAGPRVIGGAAQHLAGAHLLHHGVISATVDRAAIDDLFSLPTGPATDRLGSLAEANGSLSARAVARAVRAALARDLRLPEVD
jgi:lipoate-protein ligase A